MKKYLLYLLLFPALLFGAAPSKKKVYVNNRVLVQINGKTISVIDVMKKMDLLLFQNYPDYLEVPEAKFQFYNSQWKTVLSDWIDRELVLADAEQKKFEVSAGDVREELEEIFGPNVMLNLDSTGLTVDEAFTMLKDEITIRRMLFMQVRQRVYPEVTPTEVHKRSEEHINKITNQKECVWSAISLKSSDIKEATEVASAIDALLKKETIAFTSLQEELNTRNILKEPVVATFSGPFRQKSEELTASQQELFFSMKQGQYSLPQLQNGRSGQVVRIYYVHEIVNQVPPTIGEIEAKMREELIEQFTDRKTDEYFKELQRHFHVDKAEIVQELPANFIPFELK